MLIRTTGSATCTLGLERGTSMATPIAAGNAALVQQYFQEGWYPTGTATAANAILPSAALIKAVLLGERLLELGIRAPLLQSGSLVVICRGPCLTHSRTHHTAPRA